MDASNWASQGMRRQDRTFDITMDIDAAELVIPPARNVPLMGAWYGNGRLAPIVLAQSFAFRGPVPRLLQCQNSPRKYAFALGSHL